MKLTGISFNRPSSPIGTELLSHVSYQPVQIVAADCLLLGVGHLNSIIITVSRRKLVGGLSHQTLFLRHSSLLHILCGSGATAPLPQEDHNLADQHTESAGSQPGKNTENCRNDNKTNDAGNGTFPTTVMHMVHVMVVMRATVKFEGTLISWVRPASGCCIVIKITLWAVGV